MHKIVFWLRFVAAWIWFLCASLAAIALLPFRWKDPSMGAVFARILASLGMPILGLRMRLENASRLYTNQPCIYVANHQSNLDIITMSGMYPYRTVVIGKKELKWIPLFGLFFAGSGNIMIDRKRRTHAVAGLDKAVEAMRKRGISIWIFPEGTRNRGAEKMLPFKKGAFHMAVAAQVPIVPIVHQHLYSYCEIENRRLHGGDVLIRVLEPVSTTGMTANDVPKLMDDVRARMEAELGKPEFNARCEI